MQQLHKQGYYLETPEELRAAVAERQKRQPEIRAALNRWMKEEYGIEDMSGLTRRFFEGIGVNPETTTGVLARQIGTVNAEGLAFHLGCDALGLESATLCFGKDQFSVHSIDKRATVEIPWIVGHSKNGAPIVKYEWIPQGARNVSAIDQMALERIKLADGTPLTEFHHGLRQRFFGNELPYRDISDLLIEYFREAAPAARPNFAHVTSEGGRVEQVSLSELNGHVARPPAKWYYPLYFTWFLDGSMVLFETYENPDGQVAEAKALFEKAMELVREKTGFYPLVARTPVLSKDMLFCNRALIERTEAANMLRERAKLAPKENIHNLFRFIADEAVAFR